MVIAGNQDGDAVAQFSLQTLRRSVTSVQAGKLFKHPQTLSGKSRVKSGVKTDKSREREKERKERERERRNRQRPSTSSEFQMSDSAAECEMDRPSRKCQQSQLLDNKLDAAAAICIRRTRFRVTLFAGMRLNVLMTSSM